jgi:hypothetical protein
MHKAKPQPWNIKSLYLGALLFISASVWFPFGAIAGTDIDRETFMPGKALVERFSMDFRALAYGIMQEPSYSTQNRGNNFLQIPRHLDDLEVRPDMRFNLDPLDLMAKRGCVSNTAPGQEKECVKHGSKWDDEWYINEWLARVKMRENIFVSYGRENLQWALHSFSHRPIRFFWIMADATRISKCPARISCVLFGSLRAPGLFPLSQTRRKGETSPSVLTLLIRYMLQRSTTPFGRGTLL